MKPNYSKIQQISVFLPTLTPGGVERAMINLTKGFIKKGVDTAIVTADGHGEFKRLLPQDSELVDLSSGRVLKSITPLAMYFRKNHPDVVISGHTHANIASVIASELSQTDVKTIVSAHNPHSSTYQNTNGAKSQVIKRLFPIAYRRANKIIPVSKGIKKDLVINWNISPHNMSVIYNPVVSDDLYRDAEKSISHRWFDDENIDVVMSAGRLSPEKDYETLIRAFKKIQSERQKTKLVIAGSGSEESFLRETINQLNLSNHVELLGFVDNPYAYMRRADAFALTSKWEGLGNVLIESMAVGTPVLSTDCPTGPREILKNGKYGPLVPVGDESAIADAINQLIENPIDSKKLKNRSQDFSIETISDKYINVL